MHHFSAQVPCSSGISHFRLAKKSARRLRNVILILTLILTLLHAPQPTQDKPDRHQPGHGAHGHLPAQSPLHNARLSGRLTEQSSLTGYEPIKTMVPHSLKDTREAYVKKDKFFPTTTSAEHDTSVPSSNQRWEKRD